MVDVRRRHRSGCRHGTGKTVVACFIDGRVHRAGDDRRIVRAMNGDLDFRVAAVGIFHDLTVQHEREIFRDRFAVCHALDPTGLAIFAVIQGIGIFARHRIDDQISELAFHADEIAVCGTALDLFAVRTLNAEYAIRRISRSSVAPFRVKLSFENRAFHMSRTRYVPAVFGH